MSLNVADVLHSCRLFADLPPEAFGQLARIARICRFDKREMIFHEGRDCPGMYVVGAGQVQVFRCGAGGKEHVLRVIEPGGTFAEVAAMGRFPCPANAEAIVPTTCVLLPLDAFHQTLRNDHELCLGMMAGLAKWVRHLLELMEDVVLRDAAGRLARYLLHLDSSEDGVVTLPTMKRLLASHLDLTQETFSRTLRRLAEAGLIADEGRNQIRLLDLEQLRNVADGMGVGSRK